MTSREQELQAQKASIMISFNELHRKLVELFRQDGEKDFRIKNKRYPKFNKALKENGTK